MSNTNAPEKQTRILVVDDDQRLRDLLNRYLNEQGFNVRVAENGTAMDKLLSRERFDLLVLDLMLPGEDGLSILRRLRNSPGNIPVLMLTAKGDDVDRIVGLEMGADDYLPKPFNPRELLARIHAILRRKTAPPPPGSPDAHEKPFEFGGFMLNLATRTLSKGKETVSLTSGEFALLKTLTQHAGTPLSRDKLMELARGREFEAFDRAIDVQVSRLRKIIESDPAKPVYIQTVWGFGYVFMPDGNKS